MVFIHIDVFLIIYIHRCLLTKSIIPLLSNTFFLLLLSRRRLSQHNLLILDWNTAEDKMWNGIGWYGFIGIITKSTNGISLLISLKRYFSHSEKSILNLSLP